MPSLSAEEMKLTMCIRLCSVDFFAMNPYPCPETLLQKD
jgi:hypothetical protein